MVRIIIAAIVGGALLFGWSYASWMFIPWHQLQKLPNEAAVASALNASGADSGVFVIPGMEPDAMGDQAAMDAFKASHEAGPLAYVVYQRNGKTPMDVKVLVIGGVLDVVLIGVAGLLLHMAAPSLSGYGARVLFVFLIGVYTAVGTHLVNWNWVNYPTRHTLELVGDTLAAGLIVALVLAAIIKRP